VVDHNVLRLKIPIDDLVVVEVLDDQQELADVELGIEGREKP